MAIAVAGFFLTRAVAASNHDISVRDASEWYARGQRAQASGDINSAIDSYRRATVRDRSQGAYVLALARALALNHDDEAARGLLLTLRESDPESAEINLELARIAAGRHDVTETLRFYHNALYAPWPIERTDERRDVRFELVGFLLAHRQTSRALSELLAVAADLPAEPAMQARVGQLFAQAGDVAHALEHFQRALRSSSGDAPALAGAGQSAFQLGQYALARTYLRRAAPADPASAATLDVTEHVLADDPLAARLGTAERRRRLTADLEYLRQRLAACADPALDGEMQEFAARLPARGPLDQDVVEAGVDLVARAARHVVDACAPPAARDRGLVLIGREHGGDTR